MALFAINLHKMIKAHTGRYALAIETEILLSTFCPRSFESDDIRQ